jgi:hypothetical protein
LGLTSYFSRFIPNHSIIAKPLFDLIRKDAVFKFGAEELEAYDNLKGKLSAQPLLALYSPHCKTEMHCDVSSLGFGSILMQKQPDLNFHPVFYFSKRTNNAESKYHSYELETLAIVYSLQRFRVNLQGIRFKILTDCMP